MGRPVRVVNRTRETLLAARASHADRAWSRMRGLLGAAPLSRGEGMVLEPCRSIHTFFMGYPIDVVFAARDGRVVGLVEELGPWRMTRLYPSARCALELPAGTVAATHTARGDVLVIEPVDGPCDSS